MDMTEIELQTRMNSSVSDCI